MNRNIRRLFKLIYSIVIIFILINICFTSQSYGLGNNTALKTVHPIIATIGKTCMAVAQVVVSGFFVIRFTWEGIQYFTATAVDAKKNNKTAMERTVFYAVITYLAMFLFTKALGL